MSRRLGSVQQGPSPPRDAAIWWQRHGLGSGGPLRPVPGADPLPPPPTPWTASPLHSPPPPPPGGQGVGWLGWSPCTEHPASTTTCLIVLRSPAKGIQRHWPSHGGQRYKQLCFAGNDIPDLNGITTKMCEQRPAQRGPDNSALIRNCSEFFSPNHDLKSLHMGNEHYSGQVFALGVCEGEAASSDS